MSSKDDTIVDAQPLAHDDLLDAYDKLAKAHRSLKRDNGMLNQKLHQEISQRKVYENSLNDVQGELDSLNEIHAGKLSAVERKSEEIKEKYQKLIMANLLLENKIDDMSSLIKSLENECTELKAAVLEKKIKPRYSDTFAKSLELENDSLREVSNRLREQVVKLTGENECHRAAIEELTENIACLKDNLASKRTEADEKSEMIEQLQEKMHQISSELALLRNSNGDLEESNRKGNSLFAEVDDQRQKMKKILQGERSHYFEMKKAVNAREMEIRRLKRENLNIKSEIEACSRLLKRGEQLSMGQTQVYITQLECDKQILEKQLRESEGRLNDVLKEKKMHWVETILTTTTKESRELKDKNYILLREKTLLADNHSKTLRDLSKARLESIKLKVLLGRIVDEHKLKIDEKQYGDIGIPTEVYENLMSEGVELIESEEEEEEEESEDTQQKKQMEEKLCDESSMADEGALNESTIILLGGRERLGNAIPKDQLVEKSGVVAEEKENKPAVSIKTEPTEIAKSPPPLQEKCVQFSQNVTTKVIDSTKEEFEASNEARKKRAFTVKRIVIPSRPRKVESKGDNTNNWK